MLMRFYNLYIVITSILLVSLVNYNYQDLEKIGSSSLAFGIETEHET